MEKPIGQSFKYMKADELITHYVERESQLKETQIKIEENRKELIRLKKIELSQAQRLQTVKFWIQTRYQKITNLTALDELKK